MSQRSLYHSILRAGHALATDPNRFWRLHGLAPARIHPGPRFFCQNSGGCGSAYIIKLLAQNGILGCYHEKRPDLDDLGILFFEGKVSAEKMRRILSLTREDIFFEANNRLFAVGRELREVFPDAKFIHLHRDARDTLVSSRSKPDEATWGSERLRYASEKLCGPSHLETWVRACHYWANYNSTIVETLEGAPVLSLKFADLVAGRLDPLADFLEHPLSTRKVEPANNRKPIRKEGRFPPFEEWPRHEQEVLYEICGEVMQKLGYSVP